MSIGILSTETLNSGYSLLTFQIIRITVEGACALFRVASKMVHVCCVPCCSSRSNRERNLSYFGLPLQDKKLLKQWIHRIGRANLPLNRSTRICSRHFIKAEGRKLCQDEVPSENLPVLSTRVTPSTRRKPPKERTLETINTRTLTTPVETGVAHCDKAVNTEFEDHVEMKKLTTKVEILEQQLEMTKQTLDRQKFRLSNIADNDKMVAFYTGFPSYACLKACFNFLGPAVHQLTRTANASSDSSLRKGGRPCTLPPLEEFFIVLVRLRLGLMEQDIAFRFGISQSTVSRVTITWINFLYLQFQQIPLWPCKEYVQSYMPAVFKDQYPSTRVILDATEIYIEQPRLPELQQMTFSNYKNHNTYKALIRISPSGAITFVSKLFSGSISDKELTRRSGILELLEPGDSVMADKGFDIEEDLIPLGVKLNIPPFLRGKAQFNSHELVQTRRIASLRIHVERAMERIKNFHIFDRTLPVTVTGIADRMFCVCCYLSNFHPPLCT